MTSLFECVAKHEPRELRRQCQRDAAAGTGAAGQLEDALSITVYEPVLHTLQRLTDQNQLRMLNKSPASSP